MAGSETSYAARGNFPDVEEGIARQNHLETSPCHDLVRPFRAAQRCRTGILRRRREGSKGLGEVCQRAHMKSFSMFTEVFTSFWVVCNSIAALELPPLVGDRWLSKAIFC
jgi:hypothetical protein